MKKTENKFKKYLESLYQEVERCSQIYYCYFSLHKIASSNEKTHKALNMTPEFWSTCLYCLESSLLIGIGRLFEGIYSVEEILKTSKNNLIIFSKESLKVRKQSTSDNANKWIHEYLENVYVPSKSDFLRLEKCVEKYKTLYREKVKETRKYFAHPRNLVIETNINDIQKIIIFSYKLYNALWELYNNGRKPILRQIPFSLDRLLKSKTIKGNPVMPQSYIVNDTKKILDILTRAAGDTPVASGVSPWNKV